MFVGLSVPKEEYLDRIRRTRIEGACRGFHAVVVTGFESNRLSNLRYIANYRPWLGITPSIFDHRGRGFGAVVIPTDPHLDPILVCSSPYYEKENVVVDDVILGINVPKMIGEALEKLGIANGIIGLVGEDVLPVLLYEDLRRYACCAKFVFCDDIILNMRKRKSPAELEILKKGAHIGHLAAQACVDAFKEGITEKEVVSVIENALIANGATDPWAMCMSGPRAYDPQTYPFATDRILQKGDVAFMEIMGDYNGYYIDLCRAGIIGGAQTPEQKLMMDTVFQMSVGMRDIAKPGVTAADLQWAAADVAKAAGLGHYSIVEYGGIDVYAGHGLGLNIDEPPILTVSDMSVMEKDMVMAVEPALYQTPWGAARIERCLHITENGAEFYDEFEEGWW